FEDSGRATHNGIRLITPMLLLPSGDPGRYDPSELSSRVLENIVSDSSTIAPDSARGDLLMAPPPADMPIPDRLNIALSLVVFMLAVALLWLGSRCESWYATLGIGIVFSYVLLTNYALLHEATHGNLHSRVRGNFWLGVLTGILFPVPFSMVRTTHQGHHLRN